MDNKQKKHTCTLHPTAKEKLEFICLEPQCRNQRLLCKRCLKEPLHSRHKIALIHSCVQPFSRLCFNKEEPKSHHQMLSGKLHNIKQIINHSQQKLNRYFEQIKYSFLEPLQIIVGTYSGECSDFAIRSIENQPNNNKLMDQIAYKINLLLKMGQNEYSTDLDRFKAIQKHSESIIAQMNTKIKNAIETMKLQLSELNLASSRSSSKYDNREMPTIVMNRSVEDSNINTSHEDRMREAGKMEQNMQQVSRIMKEVRQRSKNIYNDQEEIDEIERKYGKVKKVRREKTNAKVEVQHAEKKKTSRKQHSNPNKSMIDVEPPVLKNQEENDPSMMQPDQNLNKQDSYISEQEAQQLNITSWIVCADKPITELPKSCFKKITTLQISNLQNQPQTLFTVLQKLRNLQEISIFDHVVCEENNITRLLEHLPKSISSIYLNCSNEFSKNCISILQRRQLTSITRLEYFYDIQRLLKNLDESLYFRDRQKGIRVQPLDVADTRYLLECLPNLKNLWIRVKNFKPGRKKMIKLHNIQSLIIGQLEDSNQKNEAQPIYEIPERLAESLTTARNVKCLVLFSLQVDAELFLNVIRANEQLQTLNMQLCLGIKEQTLKLVTYPISDKPHSKLRNFSFKECSDITGAFVQSLANTQIFILDHIVITNQELSESRPTNPYTSFEQCESLTYFNMFGNPYFNDNLLSTLKNSFRKLRSLNVGFTCITQSSIELFKEMTEIECLCLDQNVISSVGLVKICGYLPKIQRLSVCGYNGQKNKGEMSSELLNEIGQRLPLLRHLSLRNCCKVSGEDIDLNKLPKLRTVELDSNIGQSLINTLRIAGIKVFDDN